MPSHNYARFIPDAIRSLQRQTLADWECIVVDDGSTDATASLVAQLATTDRRLQLVRQPNRGQSAARNAGLARARGRYVQFLDSDDTLQPKKLASHVRYLDQHPEAEVAFGDWAFWAGSSDLDAVRPSEPPALPRTGQGRAVMEPLLRENPLAVHCVLVRAQFAREAVHFDESLNAMEDWDVWLRLALAGRQFHHVTEPGTMALVRTHPASWSKDRIRMLAGTVALRQRIQPDLSEAWQQQLNRRLLGQAEAWLGVRMGVNGSVGAGMRLVVSGAVHARRLTYLAWAVALPFAASRLGWYVGVRVRPGLYSRRPSPSASVSTDPAHDDKESADR